MQPIELDAYLARVGLKTAPGIDVEGLRALQWAHRLAIPFENLDIHLGRAIDLTIATLFEKIVVRRRGGYCFEQNGLFQDALATLGFEVRPLLARVWLGQTETPPHTHSLLLASIEGQDWIADAGFRANYTPPMPLVEGAFVETPDGARHRILADPQHGWMVERRAADAAEWRPQFSFTTETVWSADLAMSNHYASTMPGTRHTSAMFASIALPRGYAALTNLGYVRYDGADNEAAIITSPKALRSRLSLIFGIDLLLDEVERLFAFAEARDG